LKALEVLPRLTDEIMEKIEKILDNKPSPVVGTPPFVLACLGRAYLHSVLRILMADHFQIWGNSRGHGRMEQVLLDAVGSILKIVFVLANIDDASRDKSCDFQLSVRPRSQAT